MKVNDLVILLFSSVSQGTDEEVRQGGAALFTKHVRKNILGNGVDDLAMRDHSVALRTLATGRLKSSPEPCLARRAWLLEAKHWQSGIESVADLELIASTDPLPDTQHPFNENLGIYIVAHFDHSILTAFGVSGQNISSQFEGNHVEKVKQAYVAQSTGLVEIFKELGIPAIRKLCFLACKVAVEPPFKSLLIEFVEKLHAADYDPMVAGWDIPVEVETGDNNNYGRKKSQNEGGALTKTLRESNKFVYVYQSQNLEFRKEPSETAVKDKIRAHQTELEKTGMKKKKDPKQVWMGPVHEQSAAVKEGKGKKINVQIEYVKRVKYTASQWSM
jgi:hypothetical protein